MKILLTGASGQLGQSFRELFPDVVATYHHAHPGGIAMPVEDAAACERVIAEARPDWVLHAAAMTNVDGCERDPEAARRANALGSENVARACMRAGARLLVVSTDYVYDGRKGSYREEDATNPISVYGASKLEGERLALQSVPDAIIARTSVVFGPHKKNFVTWLVEELRAGRGVRIVEDQFVNPTLTSDLSEQLLALMRAGERGVFHTAGATSLSRLEMALQTAAAFGLDADLITPIRSTDLSWAAARPANSTLDVQKVSKYKPPLTYAAALERLKHELAAKAGRAS